MAARAVGGTGAAAGIEYRVLGSPRSAAAVDRSRSGGQTARRARGPAAQREPGRFARPADRRAVGRRSAADGREKRAGVRLPAAQAPPGGRRSSRGRPDICSRSTPGELDLSRFEELLADAHARARRPRAGRPSSCTRRSRSGAGRRSPSSSTSRSPRPRSAGSRSCDSPRSRSASRRISRSAATSSVIGELEGLIAENPYRERLRGG